MRGVRRGMVAVLILLIAAVAVPLAVRWMTEPRGPSFSIVLPSGAEQKIDLAHLRRMPQLVRRGEAQNQFGNWKDGGTYSGVLLTTLLSGTSYDEVDVVAKDGYRMTIERTRVEDPDYPMVLAYALDGISVPAWKDGFRLVVLPEGGRVSNEEYRALSAGSYWVKNVVRIVLRGLVTTTSANGP